MYFYYILKKYLFNYLIIIFSLSSFYVMLDLILNSSKLPDSFNLKILYIYYTFLYSIDIFYSLAFVFALLVTIYHLVKNNELVSFLSGGFSLLKLFSPILLASVMIFIFLIILQFTKFSYSLVYAKSIINNSKFTTKYIFLKWHDRIIYIEKLDPVLKEAKNMKIFYINNLKIDKIIESEKAFFYKDYWHLKNAKITYISDNKLFSVNRDINVLEGFKPKILSNLKKLNSLSFYDIFIALNVFKDVSLNSILSLFFYKIFTPLSMLTFLIIIFLNSPIHQRIYNLSFFMIKNSIFSVLLWGIHLLIYKFAKQGVLSFYFLIFPFFIVLFYSIYLIKEKS